MRLLIQRDVRADILATEKKKAAGQPHFRETAALVVYCPETNAVLFVLSEKSGTWGLPKGGNDPSQDGHSILTTGQRELLEETGIDALLSARSFQYIGSTRSTGSQSGRLDHQAQRGKRLHFIEVQLWPGSLPDVAALDETSEVRWVMSRKQFNRLAMSEARRYHWLAAMRMVGVDWAAKRKRKK